MKSLEFEEYSWIVPTRPAERVALSGALEVGESLHISGASGIGKSTLLRSVAGLLPAGEGGVLKIDGRDVVKNNEVARPLAMVFQGPQLFDHLSVEENLLLAFDGVVHLRPLSRDLKRERMEGQLAQLGLPDRLAQRAAGLSGGEHQRIAIARALLSESPVVLLDEPFSALDRVAIELVNAAMRAHQSKHQTSFLVVGHRREELELSLVKDLHWVEGQTWLEF